MKRLGPWEICEGPVSDSGSQVDSLLSLSRLIIGDPDEESRVKAWWRKSVVKPEIGSVVFVGLVARFAEHSGIYIGDNRIVSLSGKSKGGRIVAEDPEKFVAGCTGNNIYVSYQGEYAVGSKLVAERARSKIGEIKKYNLFFRNCHQFTAGCLLGDFSNPHTTLTAWPMDPDSTLAMWSTGLKQLVAKELGANIWRIWDSDLRA